MTDKRAAAHQAKDQYDHEVGRALPLVSAGNEAAEKSVALNEIVALKVTLGRVICQNANHIYSYCCTEVVSKKIKGVSINAR